MACGGNSRRGPLSPRVALNRPHASRAGRDQAGEGVGPAARQLARPRHHGLHLGAAAVDLLHRLPADLDRDRALEQQAELVGGAACPPRSEPEALRESRRPHEAESAGGEADTRDTRIARFALASPQPAHRTQRTKSF